MRTWWTWRHQSSIRTRSILTAMSRHLRLKYPTKIFRTPSFEVDDEGNPFYVATVYQKQWTGSSSCFSHYLGCYKWRNQGITADVQNGWTEVYPAKVIEQINYSKYKDSFWNAMISRKMPRPPDYSTCLSVMTSTSTQVWHRPMQMKRNDLVSS